MRYYKIVSCVSLGDEVTHWINNSKNHKRYVFELIREIFHKT